MTYNVLSGTLSLYTTTTTTWKQGRIYTTIIGVRLTGRMAADVELRVTVRPRCQ